MPIPYIMLTVAFGYFFDSPQRFTASFNESDNKPHSVNIYGCWLNNFNNSAIAFYKDHWAKIASLAIHMPWDTGRTLAAFDTTSENILAWCTRCGGMAHRAETCL